MIGGGAIGAMLVSSGPKVLKATLKALPSLLKGSKYTKALYMELLALLFEILAKVRKEGLMSIESDVEDPHDSPIFSKYPDNFPAIITSSNLLPIICVSWWAATSMRWKSKT